MKQRLIVGTTRIQTVHKEYRIQAISKHKFAAGNTRMQAISIEDQNKS